MEKIFLLIFFISFLLAWKSMDDYYSLSNKITQNLKEKLLKKSFKGTIIFLKNKIKHYTTIK